MHKIMGTAAAALTVGTLLVGSTIAQNTAATPKPKSTTTSTTTTKTGTATKTAATTKPSTTAKPAALTTEKDKQSYAIGMSIGNSLKLDKMDLDPAVVGQGVRDAMGTGPTQLTEAEAKEIINKLRGEIVAKRQAEVQKQGENNKTAGQQFLAANKSKEGVVTLPSGLQYKVLKQGTGPKPTASDTVSCNYRGTLIDGTEFDNSEKHGGAVSFPVGQVIKGWTEALQLMPVGSKYELYVPADLAYGERSPGPEIGPNSTLVFDVELLSIQKPGSELTAQPEAPPTKQ